MRAIIERVSDASVTVEGETCGAINTGLLVYLGVDRDDTDSDITYIADKVCHLRVFPDEQDRLNLDVRSVGGQVLVISAFTVQADARKGRRPSFDMAAPPERANELYEKLCARLSDAGLIVAKGRFRAMMSVRAVNDGPICILLDSKRIF